MRILVLFIRLLSRIPTPLLYGFSNFLSLVMLRLIPYRKKVIDKNLQAVFPNKSKAEIKKIRLEFYSFFTDLMVEGLKQLTISKSELKKRMKYEGFEQVDEWISKGNSALVLTYHYSNWEWGFVGYSAASQVPLDGIYQPMSNKEMGGMIENSRSRFGAHMIPMQETYAYLEEAINKDGFALGLIPDQSPVPFKGFWMEFLGLATPVYRGPENLARRYNLPVYTIDIQKEKQGMYTAKVELLCDDPSTKPANWISEEFMKHLERKIKDKPAHYLWSHKRWKHDIPEDLADKQLSKRYAPPESRKIDY